MGVLRGRTCFLHSAHVALLSKDDVAGAALPSKDDGAGAFFKDVAAMAPEGDNLGQCAIEKVQEVVYTRFGVHDGVHVDHVDHVDQAAGKETPEGSSAKQVTEDFGS